MASPQSAITAAVELEEDPFFRNEQRYKQRLKQAGTK